MGLAERGPGFVEVNPADLYSSCSIAIIILALRLVKTLNFAGSGHRTCTVPHTVILSTYPAGRPCSMSFSIFLLLFLATSHLHKGIKQSHKHILQTLLWLLTDIFLYICLYLNTNEIALRAN